MLTLNVAILVTVFFCFHSVEGFIELSVNITTALEALQRVTGQIVACNESELQQFGDILDYFVNRTLLEREIREEVNRQTNSNATDGDKEQDLTGILPWETAINEAFYEENITSVNTTLQEQVIEFLNTYVINPVKDTLASQAAEARKNIRDDYDEEATDSEEYQSEYNPFWETPTRRIYQGKRTKIKLFPFVSSVLIFEVFACAGSIIKSDLVITAASCLQLAHNNRFFRENPAFLSVRVGSYFFSVGGEVVPVIEVYFHPTYDPKTLHDNLAIMRLIYVLNFEHRSVKKIDFDRSPFALPENTPGITIIGFGSKTTNNKVMMNERLHTANLDYYDKVSCREIYGKKFVTRNNFCAGFITKGIGACNRDVGDPGVVGRYLMGVTSFGSPVCGQPDTPTVFTKLGYYTDWIEEVMEQKVPRLKVSTTTKAPFLLTFDQKFTLFGLPEKEKPIPLLRQPAEETLDLDQDLNNFPIDYDKDVALGQDYDNRPVKDEDEPNDHDERDMQEYQMDRGNDVIRKTATDQHKEINPDEDADPEVKVKDTGTPIQLLDDYGEPEITQSDQGQSDENNENDAVREGPQGKNELEINYSEEKDNNDYVELVTAKVDLDPIQQDTDTDAKNVVRTAKPETNEDFDAPSTEKPINVMGDVHSEEALSDIVDDVMPHMDANFEENFAKLNEDENNSGKSDKNDKNDHGSEENIRFTIMRNKHTKPPVDLLVEDANSSKHRENPTKPKKSKKSPNVNSGLRNPKELNKNDESVSESAISALNEKETPPYEPQADLTNDITEEMVKLEIQKLLDQLERSNELIEEHQHTNNTPLRNLVLNMDTEEGKTSDTVLTFLYLTDSEKKPRLRAIEKSEEGGLSIDAEAFQKNMLHRNDSIGLGKSEIYGIFADVMNTVNKTIE